MLAWAPSKISLTSPSVHVVACLLSTVTWLVSCHWVFVVGSWSAVHMPATTRSTELLACLLAGQGF